MKPYLSLQKKTANTFCTLDGTFIKQKALKCPPRPRVSTRETFWDFACSCTSEIHNRIRHLGSHRNVLKLFQCINPEPVCALSRFNADNGLYRELFNFTNLGSLSIDPEGKSPYRFAGSPCSAQRLITPSATTFLP